MTPDIFISYAREDREIAHDLADELESRGWTVWWDREIAAGERFDQAIAEALDSARCVVVLWSEASGESRWVRDEAATAFNRGVLVPALIEDTDPPLGFRSVQAANLTDWHPGDEGEQFEYFLNSISKSLAHRTATEPQKTPRRSRRWRRRSSLLMAAVTSALAVAVLLLILGGPATDSESNRTDENDQAQSPDSPEEGPPTTPSTGDCVPNPHLPLNFTSEKEFYKKVKGNANGRISDGCPGRVTGSFRLESINWLRGIKAYAHIRLLDDRQNVLQTVKARTWVDSITLFMSRNVYTEEIDEAIDEAIRSQIRNYEVELIEEQ